MKLNHSKCEHIRLNAVHGVHIENEKIRPFRQLLI